MDAAKQSRLRPGNKAFNHLIANYELEGTKTGKLVEVFPELATQLHRNAQKAARCLTAAEASNTISRYVRAFVAVSSGKQKLLENCIFDLMLTVCFQELCTYSEDKEVASVFVDALLYQATGSEPTSPTEMEFRFEGTHKARGLQKYVMARQQLKHIGDNVAWLFGKEVAALRGDPNDVADVVSVSSVSFLLRVHAKWIVRYFLYGTWPTEAERESLQKTLAKQEKELFEIFKTPPNKSTQ